MFSLCNQYVYVSVFHRGECEQWIVELATLLYNRYLYCPVHRCMPALPVARVHENHQIRHC